MPGPIYNWLCVAHSIVDVLSNAAAIRASQVYPRTTSPAVQRNLERGTARPVNLKESDDERLNPFVGKAPLNALDGMGDTHIGMYEVFTRVWYSSILQAHLQRLSVLFSGHPILRLSARVLRRPPRTLHSSVFKSSCSPSPEYPSPLPNQFLLGRSLRTSLW